MGKIAWSNQGAISPSVINVTSSTGDNTTNIPLSFGHVPIVGDKSAFTQPQNMVLEYSTNGGTTWVTYPLNDGIKKEIFLSKGVADTFFMVGGPNATGKTGEKTRLTINAVDRYTTLFGVYIWASTNGAGNILCDIEIATFDSPSTFNKRVTSALLGGWGGPNYVGLNVTYGGSDDKARSVRFTFSCDRYVSGKVAEIGEISLLGRTNWTMPYNLARNGHLYDWDGDQNAIFPAIVSAYRFDGRGDNLTNLNANNITAGKVPIANLPTGTSASTVALGNHTHSQYSATNHTHSAANITSGTLSAARLPTSGVTAGSYGPTANVTGSNGATINIPQITVDAYGRVTGVTNRVFTAKDTNTTYSLSSFGITASAAELNKLDGAVVSVGEINYLDGVTSNIQTQLNGKASSSHTHNYAGSSSAGGAATSANKLNTSAGNASQPVYFSNGVPVAATAYANAITQGIKVDDTRDDNPAPNSAAFTKSALTVDFKYNSKIGSPTGFGGSYCGLLSLAPWSETSGGNGYQIAVGYNGNTHPRLAIRSADLSATSWGPWYKIYTSDDKPTLAEIGAAASSHTHSYLPLSGGTLTGRLTAIAKISATTSGGSWINGKTVTNAGYCITTQPDSAGNAYYPFFAAKSGNGHTVNLGCLGNAWGFYGFKSSRTDNGTDWQFTFDAGTGAITHNSTMTQSGAYTSKNSLDANASSSSASYSASFAIQDKNGNQMGDVQCSKQADNRNGIQIEATRGVSGTTYYNSIRLCINNTGGLSYMISSPAAFRNILGLGNTAGAVPVANGGSGAAKMGCLNNTMALYNLGVRAGTGAAPSSGTAGMIYIQYS